MTGGAHTVTPIDIEHQGPVHGHPGIHGQTVAGGRGADIIKHPAFYKVIGLIFMCGIGVALLIAGIMIDWTLIIVGVVVLLMFVCITVALIHGVNTDMDKMDNY